MRFFYKTTAVLVSSYLLSLVLLLGVSALPQWVWNKDVIDNSRGQTIFADHSTRFPESSGGSQKSQIRVEGSPRLIPSAINAISNSIQSSNIGGGLNGIFGSVLQNIPQLAAQAIGGLFNRPITLPAKDEEDGNGGGGGGTSGGSGGGIPATGACKCVSQNSCFLPSKPTGSCEGGRVQCCSTSRTIFPDQGASPSTGTKNIKNERTITQRELRRGLLQQILKGSGSVVDDTLDLILVPYLSKEDKQKLAIRVVADE